MITGRVVGDTYNGQAERPGQRFFRLARNSGANRQERDRVMAVLAAIFQFTTKSEPSVVWPVVWRFVMCSSDLEETAQ